MGMKAEELQGHQHEELSESLPRSWASLWHGGNCVGTDKGAGLGLPIHMLQPHTWQYNHTESAFWISVSAFCPCLPLFGPICRECFLWYFIWKRLFSACWPLGGDHCYPSFLFPKHPYSEDVLLVSIRLCAPLWMGLFRNRLYFSPSAGIKGNSQNKADLNMAYYESVPKSDCGKIIFCLYFAPIWGKSLSRSMLFADPQWFPFKFRDVFQILV